MPFNYFFSRQNTSDVCPPEWLPSSTQTTETTGRYSVASDLPQLRGARYYWVFLLAVFILMEAFRLLLQLNGDDLHLSDLRALWPKRRNLLSVTVLKT